MATELRWTDAEDIGLMLTEKFPDQNPLEVRFTELHRLVTELPTFVDDPKASNEPKLEAIQMAWYEEWKDRNE
ncbi:MAG TPA: Fe-S cluster assembly protein IscX [Clostridia bacterium]|nr:Fe-S cluster assembly protein IscX [Clostridia bacterium]